MHGEVTAWDVELVEEDLALVVEGRSLLDDGLALTPRDRWSDVEVEVELNEAVSGHELRDVGVAVARLPVVVEFREADDALTNTHSQVTPHLLRSHRNPGRSPAIDGVSVRPGDERIDHRRVEEALQIAELATAGVTGSTTVGMASQRGGCTLWSSLLHTLSVMTCRPIPNS